MFKVFVLIVAIIATVTCLPLVDEEAVVEKVGYCRKGNVYIKEGEQGPGPIGQCIRVKCVSAEPGNKKMSAVSCATFVPRDGCTVSEYDKTKPYPHCCPNEVCPPELGYSD
ncbi:hypothetical protein ILUMI_20178 [Ignelater luminosus]|uniref:Single domain-containing protein n=1 Tax=Ignelater luminosus TaxID=2038154 RepID=A0A8K0CK79_IGNLU|nr:hypothetical protein ILUMI_20178 [Ignelater luminosus]